MTPNERWYLHDPIFHALVDTLVNALLTTPLTPPDLEAALTLAVVWAEEVQGTRRPLVLRDA